MSVAELAFPLTLATVRESPAMPIYLYVKQHQITGLKYFGKTKHDPKTYPGSGYIWSKHYKKYGREHITTLQIWKFEDQQKCTEFALQFSKENNIVESSDWANRIEEDGLGGGCSKGPKTDQHKKNISKGRKGIKFSQSHIENMRNCRKGIPLSEKNKKGISLALKGKPKSPEHTLNAIKARVGYKHSEETRRKLSEAKRGKKRPPFTEETKRKMSEAQKLMHFKRKERTNECV